MVQFCVQTTCPSDSAVWFGGKFKLILKVAAAPVRVGPSFFRSKVTSPPGNGEDVQLNILIKVIFVTLLFDFTNVTT